MVGYIVDNQQVHVYSGQHVEPRGVPQIALFPDQYQQVIKISMKTRLNTSLFSPFFVALAVALCATQMAGAANKTWDGEGTPDGNW